MGTEMIEILETASIAVSGFLIKKYVFLEPDLEVKNQRIFYWASFFIIGVVFFAFGKDAASIAALLMIGLNICLGRKKWRLWGLFYVRGREWRSWFYENMQHRSLRRSESCLLWMIGIVMMFFSNELAIQKKAGRMDEFLAGGDYGSRLASFIGISSIAVFIMAAGKLTEEEFEVMKTHTTAGRNCLYMQRRSLVSRSI